jgi:lipopolysaccharide/colanic/teichoic acid biosynthesis glycosyltransferase
MSASVLDEPSTMDGANPSELSDIVDHFVRDDALPAVQWLTSLRLERPRRSIRCLSSSTRCLKRLIDIVISATMLVLLSPLMLLVALAVRATSPGPIIFQQERVGLNQRSKRRDRRKNLQTATLTHPDRRQNSRRQASAYGKSFTLYKFRTMRVDAEQAGAQFAVKNDPRVTPIGGFLRKTRLDELPQLWNVLTGEMSLVGPRPERPVFIEQLSAEIPNYLNRLGLKPGLTGLAQVINGYDNNVESFKRKVNLDLLYLQNCCAWNDLKILFRTIGVVLTGKGAL